MKPRSIYFLLYDQVEVLDFSGPFDVFSMTLLTQKINGQPAPFVLKTVSHDGRLVECLHGLKVQPDASFDDLRDESLDVLIVPGGNAGDPNFLENRKKEIGWIRERGRDTEITAAICVGGLLAAMAGLFIGGLQVTTHHGFLNKLAALAPEAEILPGVRYTDNLPANNIVTAAGVSAGIDLAMHLVERLLGAEAAAATATIMEYNRTTNWALAGSSD